jgi:hypothetical protein
MDSPTPESSSAPFDQPKKKRPRWKYGCGGILVLILFLFILYTWVVLTWSYSAGERAGYVQKLSKKGFISKTWEGELAMVSMPGQAPQIFNFTVWDDSVAAKINRAIGKRVTLKYEQHIGIPTQFFGETEYFVTDVWAVE